MGTQNLAAIVACLLAGAGAAAGCDSSDADDGALGAAANAAPLAYDDFCPKLANALCKGIERCCASSSETVGCVEAETELCEARVLRIGETLDSVSQQYYSPKAGGTTVAEVSRAADSCGLLLYPSGDSVRTASSAVAGEPCEDDGDCRRPLACIRGSMTTGVCGQPPKVGAACDSRCADEAYCGEPAVCVARPRNGEPCADGGECARGASCDYPDTADGEAICRQLADAGAKCTGDDGCLSDSCAGGVCVDLWCIPRDERYYPETFL